MEAFSRPRGTPALVLLGLLLIAAILPSRAFTLIDSGSQPPNFCTSAGSFSDIINNPNDHWWWGSPPAPPGPVVIRYQYTTAFDTAFADTSDHPDLNARIKDQIDRAFQTWEAAGTTPLTGPANYRRNGVLPAAQGFGDIRSIALHEIGHLLGFHHADGGGATRNYCPDGSGGFMTCVATGGEVMNSTINSGNYNHLPSLDELNGFNLLYGGQTLDFQRVGASAAAEITVDTYTAGPNNWALATLCGNQRNASNALQGRRTVQGSIQFNTASSMPLGFRTYGINWDYQCNSIETHEFRIRTRGTDNPQLFNRYDGPSSHRFGTYANNPVANFRDDRLHVWSDPNNPIGPDTLIHVGIEQDVWDWTVVSAIALDDSGTPCTASLISFHEWNNAFNEGGLAAPHAAPDDGQLRMGRIPDIRARGIRIVTSDSQLNRVSRFAVADATGLRLRLEDLNRETLKELEASQRLEYIEEFQERDMPPNSDFIVVFEGTENDLPDEILERKNYVIIDRPKLLDGELFLFAESANEESVSGAFALLGTPPFVNTAAPVGPRLEIARLDAQRVKVQWPAPSFGFFLQSSESLTPPVWKDVIAEVEETEKFKCVTLPLEPRHRFFRLYNPLQPGATCDPLPGQDCLE